MANVKMRINKNGERVFNIRVMVDGEMFNSRYPAKDDPVIPSTWSDKKAQTEALKAAALFEEECKRGSVSNDKRTLLDYIEYVITLKETTLKPKTISEYRKLLKRIEGSSISKLKIRDVGIRDLNTFYQELSAEGMNQSTGGKLSPRTIRIYHALLSTVLHQAAREGIIPNNPALNATLPKMEKKEANYYTPEKVSEIIDAIQKEPVFWQAMTYIFIGTGARRGEIVGLTWSDIDFENSVVYIHRNATSVDGHLNIGSTKTGNTRTVSIAPAFLEPLKTWRKEQTERFGVIGINGYCFAVTDPNEPIMPDSVTRYYARFGEKYKLGKVNPHAFRHTQASILLQDGDIVTASKRLGHAQTSTTMNIYGHMMPLTDKAAAEKVGKAFLKNKKAQ